MKSPLPKSTFLVFVALICFPLIANAQWDTHEWDDRSDEVWDEFDTGSNATTWILVGAGTALATAAIVYTVKKRRAAKREDNERTEEREEASSALRSFSPDMDRLQQLAEMQRQLPVNVRVGIHPGTRHPALGLSVRF